MIALRPVPQAARVAYQRVNPMQPTKRAPVKVKTVDAIAFAATMALGTVAALAMTALTVYVGASAFDGPFTAARATALIAAAGMGIAAGAAWAAVGAAVAGAARS
jgi:hypothetical protein